jgi:hypothetical protein
MQWFRTKARAIRLVALFLVAQFAGVVSAPLSQAHAAAGTSFATLLGEKVDDELDGGGRILFHDPVTGMRYRALVAFALKRNVRM